MTVARAANDPEAGAILTSLSEMFVYRQGQIFQFLKSQFGRFSTASPESDATNIDLMLARISKALASAKLQDLFYVRTITHKMSSEDGWAGSMELVNFLESRSLPANLGVNTKAVDDSTKIILKNLASPLDNLKRVSKERRKEAADNIAEIVNLLGSDF